MKKALLCALVALMAACAYAQNDSTYGNIAASGTSCGDRSCVWLKLPKDASTVSVVVTGTFTATLAVESSADGGTTLVSEATITAAGTYTYAVASKNWLQVRGSAYTSGTAKVVINVSSAFAYPGVTANTGASTDVATMASSSSKKYSTIGAPTNAAFTTGTDSDSGKLISGTSYCYRVVAVTSCGQTTPASAETCGTTGGGDDTEYMDVNWNAVTGAKAYYIYGRTSGAEQFLWQAPGSVTTWRDYGQLTPSGAIPATSPSSCYGNIAGIKVVHADGSTEMAVPTADTNAARGKTLLGAVWSAGDKGSVYVPAGTYDIGAGVVDQSLGGTGGVHVFGAGPYQTIITTSVPHFLRSTIVLDGNSYGDFPDCMVAPGSNTILDGVGIDGVSSTDGNPDTATSTCPWGTANFRMTYNVENAKVRNVHVTGISDGFLISNSSPTYGFSNLQFENVSCDSVVDCLTIGSDYPMTMTVHGARFTSSGAHSSWGYATNAHLVLKGGTANLFDVVGLATSPQAGDRAYSILASCGTINVHSSTLATSGTGTNYDVKQETDNITFGTCSSSTLNVGLDTVYDSTKTNGTITTFSALPKATTGTRFVCVNTSGKIVVQAAACSGT